MTFVRPRHLCPWGPFSKKKLKILLLLCGFKDARHPGWVHYYCHSYFSFALRAIETFLWAPGAAPAGPAGEVGPE